MFLSWSLAEAWVWLVNLPYLGGLSVLVAGYIGTVVFANIIGFLTTKRPA